jgi:hypothetical protein
MPVLYPEFNLKRGNKTGDNNHENFYKTSGHSGPYRRHLFSRYGLCPGRAGFGRS